MLHAFSISLFFISVIFLPWYITVLAGLYIIVQHKAYASAIIGGLLLDSMFGSPIISLNNFSYLYTALFTIISVTAFFLGRAMME